jgi:hypothetical protein
MDPLFRAIEASGLSLWVRGSSYAFPALIVAHTLGMGFLAGLAAMIDLRLLGLARRVPPQPLARLFPGLWLAFGVNLVSGLLLLIGYPTKALTNPVFYVKLGLIALAVGLLPAIRAELVRAGPDPTVRAKRLAAASLILWLAIITAGRLLAYTHTRMLVDLKAHF